VRERHGLERHDSERLLVSFVIQFSVSVAPFRK
jgi:hypothetical protein